MHEPASLRIVIPKPVVVKPRLMIEVLPLEPQILLDLVERNGILA